MNYFDLNGFSISTAGNEIRIISTDKNGENFDVDGPFDAMADAQAALAFHRSEWLRSHPDDE